MQKSWNEIKEEFVKLRDEVAKSTRELAESETSIDTLERNIGETESVTNLRIIISAKKIALNEKVNQLNAIREQAVELSASSYDAMKKNLEIYKDIMKTLAPENISQEMSDSVAVEVAKALYTNIKDNHQLRQDPDIAGVTKFERADILLALENPKVMGSNLDAFFQPLFSSEPKGLVSAV